MLWVLYECYALLTNVMHECLCMNVSVKRVCIYVYVQKEIQKRVAFRHHLFIYNNLELYL